jgi:adenosylmethionine---8-amino-7-oxononanoate aminotransferase
MELNYQLDNHQAHQIIKTEGYWNYTVNKKLLDPLCGNTSFIFGYNNKQILDSMYQLQSKIGFLKGMSNETCKENQELISKICQRGNFKSVAWAVSGSDAVEAAIYINDEYWKQLKEDRPTVVTFTPGYHGTTYLAKLFREEYPTGDRAVVIQRRNNDSDTLIILETLLEINPKIGAVLIESAPWNGGLRLWSQSWWTNLRTLCDQYNINLIVDDVLGGVGKLGYFFSHQRYGITPDIVACGKALTNGYSPLGCACTNERITDIVKDYWKFGHTWSPNMAGVGAALEVCQLFDTIDFTSIENQLTNLGQELKDLGLIKNYSSAGLLFYITLNKNYSPDSLYLAGINGNFNENNGIFICAPAIADDEYFTELSQRLRSFL